MTTPEKTRLFVYGSLRRGGIHHDQLAGACFVSSARTEACYELVDLGDYPALVEGGNTAVSGEVYEVSAALLAQLDAFEEAPSVYQRVAVRLAMLDDAQVESYTMARDAVRNAPRVAGGDWLAR